jgi:hypothetical protein
MQYIPQTLRPLPAHKEVTTPPKKTADDCIQSSNATPRKPPRPTSPRKSPGQAKMQDRSFEEQPMTVIQPPGASMFSKIRDTAYVAAGKAKSTARSMFSRNGEADMEDSPKHLPTWLNKNAPQSVSTTPSDLTPPAAIYNKQPPPLKKSLAEARVATFREDKKANTRPQPMLDSGRAPTPEGRETSYQELPKPPEALLQPSQESLLRQHNTQLVFNNTVTSSPTPHEVERERTARARYTQRAQDVYDLWPEGLAPRTPSPSPENILPEGERRGNAKSRPLPYDKSQRPTVCHHQAWAAVCWHVCVGSWLACMPALVRGLLTCLRWFLLGCCQTARCSCCSGIRPTVCVHRHARP